MKLRSILNLQTADALRLIASNCAISADAAGNKTVLIDLLCQALPDTSSVARRVSNLTSADRKLVAQLVAEGGELLEKEALVELAGGFARTFREQLAALSEQGLVFRDTQTIGEHEPIVGVPDPILRSMPFADESGTRLRGLMKTTSIGLLRTFAQQLGLETGSAERLELIRAIRGYLLVPESLKRFVTGLSDLSRAILDLLLENERVTRPVACEKLGEGADRELDELLWRTPLFHIRNGAGQAGDEDVALASDLAQALRELADRRGGKLESQPHEVLVTAPSPPSGASDRLHHLQRDLATLVGMVGRRQPRQLKRGGISRSSLKEVAAFLLADSDPGYPEFLMLFAESAGLVKPDGRVWTAAERAGSKLEDEGRVRKALLTFWYGTDRWNEWTSDRSGSAGPRKRAEELREIRRAVVQGLLHCQVGRWIAYPQFYQLLVRTSEAFRAFTEYPGGKGALSSGGTTADELLRRMLRGALAWTGVVQIGSPDACNTPLHQDSNGIFRLTDPGHALAMGKRPEIPRRTSPEARYTIQPNLEILSPPDLLYAHYIELHKLADLQGIDVVARFELSKHSLHRALNSGMPTRTVRRFLKSRSATGIPDMVESMIDECDRKHGEVEIHATPGYVSTEDESLLDELYAQESLAELLGDRLSPLAAALKQTSKPDVLFRRLKQCGYLPRQSIHLEKTRDDHHQIVLRSSELAELSGLLEAAASMLAEHGVTAPENLTPLLRRLRRGLRQVPDGQREEAEARYRAAFAEWHVADTADNGKGAVESYTGLNPAPNEKAVRELIGYAIDHKLWVEIDYPSEKPENDLPRIVEPVSEDHAMVYGYCRWRKGDRVFRLNKIQAAVLRPRESDEADRRRGSG